MTDLKKQYLKLNQSSLIILYIIQYFQFTILAHDYN